MWWVAVYCTDVHPPGGDLGSESWEGCGAEGKRRMCWGESEERVASTDGSP